MSAQFDMPTLSEEEFQPPMDTQVSQGDKLVGQEQLRMGEFQPPMDTQVPNVNVLEGHFEGQYVKFQVQIA